MRAWLRAVDWDRVMGVASLLCALIMVVSWWVNPATLLW